MRKHILLTGLLAVVLFALCFASVQPADAQHRPRGYGSTRGGSSSGGGGGVPDSGVYEVVLWLSASYGDPAWTYGPPYYTTPQRCSDDASVCAYRSRGGSVTAAAEPTNDGGPLDSGITPQIGAIQRMGAMLNRPVILVDRAFAGSAVASYSTVDLLDDLDDAVAFAADAGAVARVSILTDNSGGYRELLNGDQFTDYITDLEVHRTAVNNHIAARVDAGVAGWLPSTVTLALNAGTAQQWSVSGVARHTFNDDFVSWTDTPANNAALCGQLYHVETGVDELHPDQEGGRAMADLYGRCWARMASFPGRRASASLRGITMVDADSFRASFYVPCREEGTCLNNPPLALDTTNVVGQQSTNADVLTYGFHFYLSGVLQQPGAVSNATFLSCPAPATVCDVQLDFASLPNFDAISYADTAEVNTAVDPSNPKTGGGNFLSRLNSAADLRPCGVDLPCADWTVSNAFAVSPYDGGPSDSGVHPDAAADAGVSDAAGEDAAPSDSGIHPDAAVDAGPDAGAYSNQYFIASNGGYLSYDPDGGALDLTSTFTFCFALRDRVNDAYQSPIGRWGSPNDIIWGFGQLAHLTPRIYAVGFETSGVGFDINTPVWVSNTWIHACVVFNGTSSTAYVNGVAASLTYNGTIPSTLTVSPSSPWHILAQGSTHADLDSVVFYDTVLTQAEMDDHRCAFTGITNIDGGANPCSGQSLGQVVYNPGFIEAYLFDSPDAGPGASYTGTRDFNAVGSVSHTASPLP
jgi:hypothetical protein